MKRTHQHLARFAPLTAPENAAIAVVRIWGDAAAPLAELTGCPASEIQSWEAGTVKRVTLRDEAGVFDDALVTVHQAAPRFDLHLHLHGNPVILRQCTARLAQLGLAETTLEGRTIFKDADPLVSEAAALVPKMLTRRGCAWLLRQPRLLGTRLEHLLEEIDDEIHTNGGAAHAPRWREECRRLVSRATCYHWFSNPLRIAVVGPPNAGKSTLVNALSERETSLVSSTPGTTRDWVAALSEWEGMPFEWIDTAGWRTATDDVERGGIAAARDVALTARLVLLLLPIDEAGSPAVQELVDDWDGKPPQIVALNKCDLHHVGADVGAAALDLPPGWPEPLALSARTGEGLDALHNEVVRVLGRRLEELEEPAAFSSHLQLLLHRVSAAGPNTAAELLRVALHSGAPLNQASRAPE